MQNKYIFLIFIFFLLNACQTIQDGLAGNKNKNSDEFLIEKKNPLEIPPDFGSLPKPKAESENADQAEEIEKDIEKLLQHSEIDTSFESKDKSAEDFVLKQIKNN
tara:strand:+ start:176 stop:490 length:315 start_codon:yes stop_codon:yes gene_type:complete